MVNGPSQGWAQILRRRWMRVGTRYPIADTYLPSNEQLDATADRQTAWSREFALFLERIQSVPQRSRRDAHLTWWPIARNVRAVATHLYRNSRRGVQTVIVAGNEEEERLLATPKYQQFLDPIDGRNLWKPWLWSRIPRGQLHNIGKDVDDAELAWPLYFSDLNTLSPGFVRSPPPRARPPGTSVKNRKILGIAACSRYAFRLSPEVQAAIDVWNDEMGWEPDRRVLGIHVRRGDAAADDLTQTTRESFSLETYLAHADVLCDRYDIDTIYLSTESLAEVERAQALRPDYRFLYLRYDRGIFPRIGEDDRFIEFQAFRDPSIIEPIVTSALADLYFLQRADAFIGTFSSEFSMLAWLLCIGQKGYVMPYVNMSPQSKLHHARANLAFETLWWRATPPWRLFLLPRLRTAREAVRGRPLGEWPSLLRRRWKERVR